MKRTADGRGGRPLSIEEFDMQELVVANASNLLHDEQVLSVIEALQIQLDRDFLPHWERYGATPVKITFADINDIPVLTPDIWAIFLNKHSDTPGALGWHDDDPGQNIRVHSRVFVGDCQRFGLNWTVTLSHELLELILDPNVDRVFRMRDGRLAALEVCDAVESDDQAYEIDGIQVSNFVLPAYFTQSGGAPYDLRGRLRGRCPTLTPGGYMSLRETNGTWTQIFAEQADNLASRRFLGKGFRRMKRIRHPRAALKILD